MYRKNVAALIKHNDLFLGCLRSDNHTGSHKQPWWQCVQGGVEPFDQTLEDAIKREILEELGVPYEKIQIKIQSKSWGRYEFTKDLMLGNDKSMYQGQEQMWFLIHLEDPSFIHLPNTDFVFSQVKWMNIRELLEKYPPWKKQPLEDFCHEIGILP